MGVCAEIQVRTTEPGSLSRFRIYMRRDGDHFVGLCGEIQAIIDGSSVDDIVSKAKTLIARGFSRNARIDTTHLITYMNPQNTRGSI